MSLSEETNDYYSERRRHFDRLKKNTPVGIFGSFYESRKTDLRALQQFLLKEGYFPQLSEDLDEEAGDEEAIRDPVRNRILSERLIDESDIHIFILVRGTEGDPPNLIQSVSMEMERLHTLHESRIKSACYVAVYVEAGLMGTMGSVCEGLLASKKDDWNVEEFTGIREIFRPARQFCMNCILDMYNY
ncbi:hypothetical protein J2741_001498 [Methanolinea mesophila]|uniref:hypothetical protein n=1 Tax=Methanolinea mesophila TaxID=547055 RepID=UPI001AE53E2A|nr:hypothetical protein [Methanolinea mesophila]MBP1928951.1 hypothetical protein [Methanolinea mesophila]